MNGHRIKAKYKRSRQNYLSIFIIGQDDYELPREQLKQMVISITSLNQTLSETYKFFIKTKQALTWILKSLNY